MKLYLSVISVAMAIIAAVNIALGLAVWYYVILAVIWCTALQFAFDGGIAIIINKMPDSLFGLDNPLYRVSDGEKNSTKSSRSDFGRTRYGSSEDSADSVKSNCLSRQTRNTLKNSLLNAIKVF